MLACSGSNIFIWKSRAQGRSSVRLLEIARKKMQEVYNAHVFQLVIAFCICANFIASITQYQLDGQDSDAMDFLNSLDIAFSALFAMELLLNIFVHFWRPFLKVSSNLHRYSETFTWQVMMSAGWMEHFRFDRCDSITHKSRFVRVAWPQSTTTSPGFPSCSSFRSP